MDSHEIMIYDRNTLKLIRRVPRQNISYCRIVEDHLITVSYIQRKRQSIQILDIESGKPPLEEEVALYKNRIGVTLFDQSLCGTVPILIQRGPTDCKMNYYDLKTGKVVGKHKLPTKYFKNYNIEKHEEKGVVLSVLSLYRYDLFAADGSLPWQDVYKRTLTITDYTEIAKSKKKIKIDIS